MSSDETRSDRDLLAAFATAECETAFAALVRRHIGLVYSAAFQRLHDAHLAEDVVQAVFVLLARKAARLPASVILAGWLYRAAQFAANDVLKSERRRAAREDLLPERLLQPEQERDDALDSALEQLPEKDRLVILLRFFEEKSLREVGKTLGIAEEAARKRIDRALAKLRKTLSRHNGLIPTAEIVQRLGRLPRGRLPDGAAIRASTAALAGSCAASAPVLALVRAALNAMLIARLRRIVAVGTLPILLLLAGRAYESKTGIPAQQVLTRHFATLENSFEQARETRRKNACFGCHQPGKVEPTVPGMCLRGKWRDATESASGSFELRLAGADRALESITLRPMRTIVRGRNDELAWKLDGIAQLLNAQESAAFQQATTLLLRPEPIEYEKFAQKASFGEREAYRLKTPAADFYFDLTTGLFQGSVGATQTNTLLAYRDFRGLLAPSRLVRFTPDGEQIFLIEEVRMRDLPLRIFDPPPELRAIQ